jgi:recombination protein RecA
MPLAQALDDKLIKIQKTIKDDEHARIGKGVNFNVAGIVPFGIPSSIAQLDTALGRNGTPAGRIYELFGFESSGKTSLAITIASQVQNMGGLVVWIDTEHSFDADRATQLGLDVDEMWIGDAESIEGCFRLIEEITKNLSEAKFNGPVIIVVDSVGNLASEYELGKVLEGEERTGHDAKAIKRGMKRASHIAARNKITIVFINHSISNIGGFAPAKSTGGHAIKFLSSVRIEMAHMGDITKGKGMEVTRLGQKLAVKVRKARGSPLIHPNFELELLRDGFNKEKSLRDAMVTLGMIKELPNKALEVQDGTVIREDGWSDYVLSLGGFEKAYQGFLDRAIEEGKIQKWGVRADEEAVYE